MDRYKVTNGQYLKFVDAGGYQERGLWSPLAWDWKEKHGVAHPLFWSKADGTWRYQAMFEELRYRGEWPENATPLTYRVPRLRDVPEFFESFIAEHGQGMGPGGLKGIGEAGMLGIAAAIANAIEDATGASLTALPFTPEKMLAALDAERVDADRSPT